MKIRLEAGTTRDYSKIKAWQADDELALLVYKVIQKVPKGEGEGDLRTLKGLISYIEKSGV